MHDKFNQTILRVNLIIRIYSQFGFNYIDHFYNINSGHKLF